MKKFLVSMFLLILSTTTFAADTTPVLQDLQQKMTSQAYVIKRLFDKFKMSTTDGIYSDIWLQEFNVTYVIEIGTNSLALYNKVRAKDSLDDFRLETNLSHAAKLCDSSASMLALYQGQIKNLDVKVEVAKQANYAQDACRALKLLTK